MELREGVSVLAAGVDRRFIVSAREAAARLGDVAVVTQALPAQGILLTVAVCHRDPERQALAAKVLGERFRRGELLPGRVWETEREILIVDVDGPAFLAISPPRSRTYVREVGIRSMILVPLRADGRVCGTLGVTRDPGGPPYTEADYEALQALAG